MSDSNSFDDLDEDEFQRILENLVTVPELFTVGDIYSIAKEEYNNTVLQHWAQCNNRCGECGAKLGEENECTGACNA